MDESMKDLNIKDTEFGYVHAVSGPGMIFVKFQGFFTLLEVHR